MLSDLDEKVFIGLLGVVGTLYTTIGGIRGVIWNDLFQCFLMFTSLVIIIFKGVYEVGGLSRLIEINNAGGRIHTMFNFDPNPFVRQSILSLFLGQFIFSLGPYCFDQQMIQRFKVREQRFLKYRLIFGLIIYVNIYERLRKLKKQLNELYY